MSIDKTQIKRAAQSAWHFKRGTAVELMMWPCCQNAKSAKHWYETGACRCDVLGSELTLTTQLFNLSLFRPNNYLI